MRCKHGLEETFCAYCNGTYEKIHKDANKPRIHRKSGTGTLTQYQQTSLLTADKHKELIASWELSLFVKETLGNELDRDKLLNLAQRLQRTFNAMVWWYNLAYNPDKFNELDSHASTLVKRFEQFLDKQSIKIS